MDEDDGHSMRSDIRLTASQNRRTALDHCIPSDNDIGDLEAKMMLTTLGIALEEFVHRAVITER